jgi:hypothetical protein
MTAACEFELAKAEPRAGVHGRSRALSYLRLYDEVHPSPSVSAVIMLMKIGLLGGLGLIASLLALYWIRPDTNGGQALLVIIVFAVVSGIGRLIWPAQS